MSSGFPWRTALRIAWRESRASTAKFAFVMLAVAVGVGSLAGVRSFSRAFRDMLLREARTLMAGDLSVRVFEMPDAAQEELFARLAKQGVRRAWITETVSMMAAEKGSDPVLVSVKAVEPGLYPFYGSVKLDPPGSLGDTLAPDVVAVSEDLLVRMGVKKGDQVQLGGASFRIGAVVVSEPDRMAGSLNVGPRVMISRTGLERTGLLQPGSRAAQRYLLKLPPAMSIEDTRQAVQKAFPTALIADFRETHPLITRGLDRATTFLSLVSLIALVVGSLGVATAMSSHLQQKMDSIAIIKCIGGRSSQILRIYSAQALLLALGGSAAGLLVGLAVQAAFPVVIARYFDVAPAFRFDWVASLEALSIGLLCTMLFTAPPLLGIRHIRPLLILRRDMAESKPPLRERIRNWQAPAIAAVLILAGIGGIAAWLTTAAVKDAARTGAWFVGSLVVSLLILAGLSWLLMFGLRHVTRVMGPRLPASLRHGVANLHRPGNHATSVLVALSVGVMFTLTVYLIQHSILEQFAASAPPGMPNVFMINITAPQADGVRELLKNTKGVESDVAVVPSVSGRLIAIDGNPLDPKQFGDGPGRRFLRERTLTWFGERPKETEVRQGAWWTTWDAKTPQVSVAEQAAQILKLKPGQQTRWLVSGKTINATVAAIHRTESTRPGSSIDFVFTPGALDGLPVLYFGGVRVRNAEIAALQREMYKRYPAVTVINVADVLDRVQEVVDQIALVVRFISAFSILAGIIILASSVAGTRFRRIREVVILKTLGATRRRVSAIYSAEFLILGIAAGIMGSTLAIAFTNLLLKRLLDIQEYRFDPIPNAVAIVGTAVITVLSGWMASYRIIEQKPLEALRNE